MDTVEWAKEHWGKLTGVGLGGGAGLMFLAKDAIKEWWTERKEVRQQGMGDKLVNELLAILREDLRGNAALLKELTLTIGEFRDIMRIQKDHDEEMMAIARETRESQKWLERRYGRGVDQ